jgi:hypothetical protein
VTVLFADLKGSMELLADQDPEEARRLLDPVLERMMEAVHRYEGTVNQVMGDGIMALFGAPLAHEDHAVRACYAALRMQDSVNRYAEDVQRAHGVPIQVQVGLRSYEQALEATGDPGERCRIENKRHRPNAVVRDGARIAWYEHGPGDETLLLMNPVAYGLAIFQPMLSDGAIRRLVGPSGDGLHSAVRVSPPGGPAGPRGGRRPLDLRAR